MPQPSAALARAPTSDASPLAGIAVYASAMVIFPGMDAMAKILSADLSPFQITLLRFALQTVFVALVLLALGRPLLRGLTAAVAAKLALCGVLIGAGTAFFFWSLVYLPLANALAIFFVQPLVVTLLSATVLGETIGRHRLAAVAAGLVGTLIVIRPSWSAFGLAAVLPALGALCSAVMIITVRRLTAAVDGIRVQFVSGIFGGVAMAIIVAAGSLADVEFARWQPIEVRLAPLILGVAAFATLCHFLVVQAIRMTPPGVLAPFQYLEIFSATALGYLVFSDFPDSLTILGTAIILASGLYVYHRERRLARRAALASPDPGTAALPEREQEPA